jgi:hypothetical protein
MDHRSDERNDVRALAEVKPPFDPVRALEVGERAWIALTLAQRAALFSDLSAAVAEHARSWVEVASAIKSLRPGSPPTARIRRGNTGDVHGSSLVHRQGAAPRDDHIAVAGSSAGRGSSVSRAITIR